MTSPDRNIRFTMELSANSIVSGAVADQKLLLSDGNLEITLEYVDAVTVADLRWVEQHTVIRLFDSISHFIRFVGGGELRFAFSLEGDLLELSGDRVAMSSTRDNKTLVFSPLQLSLGPSDAEN